MLPGVGLKASEEGCLIGNIVRRTLGEEKARGRLSVCKLRYQIS